MKNLNITILALAVLTLASLSACVPGPVPLASIPGPALSLDQTIYPERFKTIHRCTLSIKGRTLVFNGYLKVDRVLNTIKCVAQTDMGATLFKYIYRAGDLTISYASPGFKPEWIEQFALRDATLVCLARSSATLSRGTVQERILNHAGLARYLVRRGDTEIYTVTFTYSKAVGPGIPDTITIIDKSLDYRLEIRVMDLKCIPENDS